MKHISEPSFKSAMARGRDFSFDHGLHSPHGALARIVLPTSATHGRDCPRRPLHLFVNALSAGAVE